MNDREIAMRSPGHKNIIQIDIAWHGMRPCLGKPWGQGSLGVRRALDVSRQSQVGGKAEWYGLMSNDGLIPDPPET
jgi:hypothetical protein